jgi:hypothetical protein
MKEDTKEWITEGRKDRTDESHILQFKINNILIINGPYPRTKQIDMISTQHMQIQKCITVRYIIHTVYRLHVSVTHVTIRGEVHYKG